MCNRPAMILSLIAAFVFGGNTIADDLTTIRDDYQKLKDKFNETRGKVRVMAIMSPG